MFNKDTIPFYLSIGFFLVAVLASAWLYFKWDAPRDVPREDLTVEVTLPVIDWQTYFSLSKQYENGTFLEE